VKLAATLARQSASEFVRTAVAEKLDRLFDQPASPEQLPPLAQDPEITRRTASDRPARDRRSPKLSEAATRAQLLRLRPTASPAAPEVEE